jgi:Cu(I)/Ag(I) efflux system periplasmic protein CusF
MKLILLISALALTCAATLPPTAAQTAPAATAMEAKPPEMVDAEVRKVDKEAGKVTLKHAEIRSLDMPAMTMVFKVNDAALWEKLAEGSKVRVVIEKATVGFTISKVEAVR